MNILTSELPKRKFDIGDLVRFADDPDDLFAVTGYHLVYYKITGIGWYYRLSNWTSVHAGDHHEDDLILASVIDEGELWSVDDVFPPSEALTPPTSS